MTTAKQIIYDDVEVKDCIAYAKNQTILLGSTVYKQMEKVCMVKNQPCKFFDCQFKQMARELKRKEQELDKAKQVILQALDDFHLEYCTPYYDRLLVNAKLLGIEVKDYE